MFSRELLAIVLRELGLVRAAAKHGLQLQSVLSSEYGATLSL